MGYVIEVAKQGDADRFFGLYEKYINELAAMSGDGANDVGYFRGLFDSYTSGAIPGVGLFAVEDGRTVGVALWGAASSEEDFAYGWGVYTIESHRRQGISTALRERAITELDRMGVQAAIGVVLISNKQGCESSRANGFTPTHILASMDIAEQADRIARSCERKSFYWEGDCPLCGRENQ